MARCEQPREDLMREATALVVRAELELEGTDQLVVVGFRRDGQASVFFGQDWVLHFDAQGALRRAYDQGALIKAHGHRLVRLTRRRQSDQIVLERHELSDQQQAELLERAGRTLDHLARQSRQDHLRFLRRVPDSAATGQRVRRWLESPPVPVAVASQAGLAGTGRR
jgi:hypothetical protein